MKQYILPIALVGTNLLLLHKNNKYKQALIEYAPIVNAVNKETLRLRAEREHQATLDHLAENVKTAEKVMMDKELHAMEWED